ncbi:MAG: ComEC/Rec2 family competence protein, partial [Acidobacteria bacterium]|nr:ComEC/Rec2 family competence protein [Acidobacteriota bacterium]
MFLPAVWIAAAFIAGVWLLAPLPATPGLWLSCCAVPLLFAFAALRRDFLRVALSAGLAAWIFIGALAGSLDSIAPPPNHVTSLISAGKLDTTSPLRWQGRLRSDPVRLPTGIRYEIELEQVEVVGSVFPVVGGLRLNWYRNERDPDVPVTLQAGDRVEALVRAHPPRNFMNPGAYDAKSNLARQGVHLIGTLRSPELLGRRASPPPRFSHRLARIRGNLLGRVDQMFAAAPGDAAFLRAMLLGDYSFIDHELADLFQRTSVYHILVISGAHLALLAAIVFWIGRHMHMPPWVSTLATLLVLAAFVGIVEDSPPVARAAAMSGIVLFARTLFRRVDLLNTIAVAAVALLIWKPASLFDPSFQLSFLAAAMIGALAIPAVEGSSGP